MFLSKKNAHFLNKPTKGKKTELKALPGWEDNQENQTNTEYQSDQRLFTNTRPNEAFNLLGEKEDSTYTGGDYQNQKPNKDPHNKKSLFNWDELNEMNNIECEKRLVQSIVQPVGVKIKPTQNLLTEFLKQSKSMDPIIVGSLLLSKLEVNYPFLVKAKSLYTIQHLVKKNPSFASYFKAHTEPLKSFPQPQDNADNYRRILKSVLNAIGIETQKSQNLGDNNSIQFEDPGYNDAKQILPANNKSKKAIGPNSKKLVSPNDTKKIIKGPQQKQKKQDIFDIFSEKAEQKKGNGAQFNDLILIGDPQPAVHKKNNNNITFDDLLK